MSKKRFESKRVLFVNGVRVRMAGNTSPTMGLLEEIEACHVHGNPWGDFWIESFTVKTVLESEKVYARYDAKMLSRRVALG